MSNIERKIGNGNLTDENLIDEDFEAELGGPTVTTVEPVEDEKSKRMKELYQIIDQFGIVTVCGSDAAGRPVIIISACNLPNKNEIEKHKNFFKNQEQFFDVLLEYVDDHDSFYLLLLLRLLFLHEDI
jgi:hypothetical protein